LSSDDVDFEIRSSKKKKKYKDKDKDKDKEFSIEALSLSTHLWRLYHFPFVFERNRRDEERRRD